MGVSHRAPGILRDSIAGIPLCACVRSLKLERVCSHVGFPQATITRVHTLLLPSAMLIKFVAIVQIFGVGVGACVRKCVYSLQVLPTGLISL